MTRTRLLVPLITLNLLSAPLARAQGDEGARELQERRAEAFDRGIDAMAARNWTLAHQIFSELWRERPSFDIGVSLGQIELNLKRYADAAEHLNYSVSSYPARENPERFAALKATLDEAKRHVCTLRIEVSRANATVLVDGKPVGRSPLPSEVFLDPGGHTVEARLDNSDSVIREVLAQAGKEQSVELTFGEPGVALAVPAPPKRAPEPVPRARDNTLAYVTGALAGVGLVTGVVGILVADNKDSDRDTRLDSLRRDLNGRHACGKGTPEIAECGKLSDLDGQVRTWRAISWAGFGTALAAGIATVYLAWPRGDGGQQVGVRIVASPSSSNPGLFTGLAGTF